MGSRLFAFLAGAAFVALTACSSDSASSAGPDAIPDPAGDLASSSSSSEELTEPSSSSLQPGSSSVGSSAGIASSSSVDEPASSSAVLLESSSSSPLSSDDSGRTSSGVTESSSSESPYLWNDEFDTIDTTKWTFEIGTGASGWGNNEKEYYTARSENAYVQDGILHIRANKESFEGADYTSARMITKGKFTFTYGTVEARIALPTGKGIWPAFWMLGENIDQVSWPACGEIDIIEAVNAESVVYGTNHWAYNGEHAEYGNNTGNFHGAKKDLDITQFHTYKLTWDEKLIAMYVDDFKYHEISIENNAGGTDSFHKPFFLLLNVAVGGNWPGFEIDDSQFPNEMLIDYIRVSR